MTFSPRQKEILDAAIQLIADRGIQACTIKNLATELDFSEPAVYRHFKNKKAILEGILDCFAEIDDSEFESHQAPLENLKRFLNDRLQRFHDKPALGKVMVSGGIFDNDPELSTRLVLAMHKNKVKIEGLIKAGRESGDIRMDIEPKEMFRMIAGSIRLTVTQWMMTGQAFDLIEEGQRLSNSLCLAIQNPEKSSPHP